MQCLQENNYEHDNVFLTDKNSCSEFILFCRINYLDLAYRIYPSLTSLTKMRLMILDLGFLFALTSLKLDQRHIAE